MADDDRLDAAFAEFADAFRRTSLQGILGGDAFVSIAPDPAEGSDGEVRMWAELGAALYLGKPIITVAFGGRPVPEGLRRASVRVIEGLDPAVEADRLLIAQKINAVIQEIEP